MDDDKEVLMDRKTLAPGGFLDHVRIPDREGINLVINVSDELDQALIAVANEVGEDRIDVVARRLLEAGTRLFAGFASKTGFEVAMTMEVQEDPRASIHSSVDNAENHNLCIEGERICSTCDVRVFDDEGKNLCPECKSSTYCASCGALDDGAIDWGENGEPILGPDLGGETRDEFLERCSKRWDSEEETRRSTRELAKAVIDLEAKASDERARENLETARAACEEAGLNETAEKAIRGREDARGGGGKEGGGGEPPKWKGRVWWCPGCRAVLEITSANHRCDVFWCSACAKRGAKFQWFDYELRGVEATRARELPDDPPGDPVPTPPGPRLEVALFKLAVATGALRAIEESLRSTSEPPENERWRAILDSVPEAIGTAERALSVTGGWAEIYRETMEGPAPLDQETVSIQNNPADKGA